MSVIGDTLITDYVGSLPDPLDELPLIAVTGELRQAAANYIAVVMRYAERNYGGQEDTYLIVDVALAELGAALADAMKLPSVQEATEDARHAAAQRAIQQRAFARRERARVSAAVKLAVFRRDGFRCVQCGGQEDLEVDHITPIAAGGTSDRENLQTLCRACNAAKGASV